MICAKTGLRIQLVAASYLLMLVAACSRPVPVATEWIIVKEDTTPTGHGFITYAAPSTIRKAGTRVRMWSMIDSTATQGAALDKPHFSWQDEWEYDCEARNLRPVQFREYAGKMGTGENKFTYTAAPVGGMIGVRLGSVGESLWKIACEKE
jgi:surface-adhesin protein E